MCYPAFEIPHRVSYKPRHERYHERHRLQKTKQHEKHQAYRRKQRRYLCPRSLHGIIFDLTGELREADAGTRAGIFLAQGCEGWDGMQYTGIRTKRKMSHVYGMKDTMFGQDKKCHNSKTSVSSVGKLGLRNEASAA